MHPPAQSVVEAEISRKEIESKQKDRWGRRQRMREGKGMGWQRNK